MMSKIISSVKISYHQRPHLYSEDTVLNLLHSWSSHSVGNAEIKKKIWCHFQKMYLIYFFLVFFFFSFHFGTRQLFWTIASPSPFRREWRFSQLLTTSFYLFIWKWHSKLKYLFIYLLLLFKKRSKTRFYLLPLIETHTFHLCHKVKIMSNNGNGTFYQHANE